MKKILFILIIICLALLSCATKSGRTDSKIEDSFPQFFIDSGIMYFSGYGKDELTSVEEAKNTGCTFIQECIKNAMSKYIEENGLDEQTELYDFSDGIAYRVAKEMYKSFESEKTARLKKEDFVSQVKIPFENVTEAFNKIIAENTSFEASAFSEFNLETSFSGE